MSDAKKIKAYRMEMYKRIDDRMLQGFNNADFINTEADKFESFCKTLKYNSLKRQIRWNTVTKYCWGFFIVIIAKDMYDDLSSVWDILLNLGLICMYSFYWFFSVVNDVKMRDEAMDIVLESL